MWSKPDEEVFAGFSIVYVGYEVRLTLKGDCGFY